MSQDLKSSIQKAMEDAIDGNLDALDEVFAADSVWHHALGLHSEGLDAIKQYMANLRSSYPDARAACKGMMGDGNTLVGRWTFEGRQTGPSPSLGTPPTGNSVNIPICHVYRVADGKVAELWEYYADVVNVLRQIGVIPPMGGGEE